MSTYISYEKQRKEDAEFTVRAMVFQLGINAATAFAVIVLFSILRPKNALIYSPKIKFKRKEDLPPFIDSEGRFSWIRPVFTLNDYELIDKIGCDSMLYIRFVRLLRQLFFWMTLFGVCVLMPIYIIATKYTGDWPPESGSIDTLSLSGINYVNGKTRTDLNTAWYWSPFIATYFYSLLIAFFLHRACCEYIEMRQYWFHLPENDEFMRSLMINPVSKNVKSNEAFKDWVESTYDLKYPLEDYSLKNRNPRLTGLYENYKILGKKLKATKAFYSNDMSKNKKRPQVRLGGFFCLGGKTVDAIGHYSKELKELKREIESLRQYDCKEEVEPYGWIVFKNIEHAHSTKKRHLKKSEIRITPVSHDLIWTNLTLDKETRKAKRWIIKIIYCVFVFVWMIPISALSATSNVINFIRMFPHSPEFIEKHTLIIGIVESYFAPIVMALFFILLPYFLYFLSNQQGYWTQTTLERKVFVKLYAFSIINNLLIFSLTSIIVSIYGNLKSIVEHEDTHNSTDYIMQLAKNISRVSNFWINYVCLNSLKLTAELAMIVPLIKLKVCKVLFRPKPTEQCEIASLPEFDYPRNYNLLLFFFTVSLVYSAMSPLILPFALLYFTVAYMVYKYLLLYVYETRMESGGKIWPVLFQTTMTSTVLFQCIMIVVMVFKGGLLQAYLLIPLPVFSLVYQYFYYRRMELFGSFVMDTHTDQESVHWHEITESLAEDPKDPPSALISRPPLLMSSNASSNLSITETHTVNSDLPSTSIVKFSPVNSENIHKTILKSQFQDPAYNDELEDFVQDEDLAYLPQEIYSPLQGVVSIRRPNRFYEIPESNVEEAINVGPKKQHNLSQVDARQAVASDTTMEDRDLTNVVVEQVSHSSSLGDISQIIKDRQLSN